ncbi:MAG: polysaccharide deacetylase family protein [Planctomycetota bacterium]|jgi:peptidoglycan/xylan/chitin deacetylase (PgdA/CDA1 family)
MLCLMYHRISTEADYSQYSGSERRFSLPEKNFDDQMSYLLQAGYEFLTVRGLIEALEKKETVRQKAVIVTFDDGCRSIYENALPILKKYNLPATVFVTTDPNSDIFKLDPEKERQMLPSELRMLKENSIEIGSHGVSHRPLTGLPRNQIELELSVSKQSLEKTLSQTVDILAVPGNWIDKTVIEVACQVGYRAICTSRPAAVGLRTDLCRIPRINIEGTLTLEQFRHRISPAGVFQKRVTSMIKHLPASLLGPKRWLPIRKKVISFLRNPFCAI